MNNKKKNQNINQMSLNLVTFTYLWFEMIIQVLSLLSRTLHSLVRLISICSRFEMLDSYHKLLLSHLA